VSLFSRLHSLALGQDENFTTESLAIVLEHLLAACPPAGLRLAELLSAGLVSSSTVDAALVSVTTRSHTDDTNIPDVEIATQDRLVFLEAKVKAPLGPKQLSRYRTALAKRDQAHTSLVTLSKFPLGPEDAKPDRELYWHQVAQCLRDLLESEPLPEASRFLVGEYLEFLRSHGLALDPPRSDMSRAVNAYLSSQGETNVFLGSSIRSLATLDELPELRPLAELLRLLAQALKSAIPVQSIKLWSGSSSWRGAGWIGYNIDSMSYYACFYLDRPDELVFETFKADIDPRKATGAPGRVFEAYSRQEWMNTLDLADESVHFYALPVDRQVEHLRKFLKESWQLARSMATQQPSDAPPDDQLSP